MHVFPSNQFQHHLSGLPATHAVRSQGGLGDRAQGVRSIPRCGRSILHDVRFLSRAGLAPRDPRARARPAHKQLPEHWEPSSTARRLCLRCSHLPGGGHLEDLYRLQGLAWEGTASHQECRLSMVRAAFVPGPHTHTSTHPLQCEGLAKGTETIKAPNLGGTVQSPLAMSSASQQSARRLARSTERWLTSAKEPPWAGGEVVALRAEIEMLKAEVLRRLRPFEHEAERLRAEVARLQPSATASEGIDVVARGGSTKAIDNWERLVSFKVACELPC